MQRLTGTHETRTSSAPRGDLSVSVIVCAYTLERWEDLRAAVQSIEGQSRQVSEIVLVVDHNDELLSRACREWPDHRVIANSRTRGLSGARNTGISLAQGALVAFLDDDARADEHWVAWLASHYDDDQVVAVGGAARPRWPETRPPIYPKSPSGIRGELDWVVGCTYEGQPHAASEVRNLMGCNMSFRREAFAEVGGFSEALGRVGKIPLGCEETEICIRLRQARPDARIIFEPRGAVSHTVSVERTTWRYLVARCFAEGVSKRALCTSVGRSDGLAAERVYLRRVLPKAVLRELGTAVRGRRHGMTGAAAIVSGVLATSCGYARTRLPARQERLLGGRDAPDAHLHS